MISKDRILNHFFSLVQLHSPSLHERPVADYLIQLAKKQGWDVFEDDANQKVSGNAGNLVIKIKGNQDGTPIALCAHMDQVPPCENVKPTLGNDGIIRTDGTTTLGADDKGGLAIILETAFHLTEEKLPHPDLYLFIPFGEEIGMYGTKNFDPKHLPAKNIIIVDGGGHPGSIVYQSPTAFLYDITVHGKSAHAGMEPEKGKNALLAATKLIASLPLGRIDEETTANIGKIESIFPTNVVPNKAVISGEVRSHNESKAKTFLDNMKKHMTQLEADLQVSFDAHIKLDYPAFYTDPNGALCQLCKAGYEAAGISSHFDKIGGGTDGNILSSYGYNCTIISFGEFDAHTVDEYISLEDMIKTTEAVSHMVQLAPDYLK